eukprot:8185174-Alexandrium_andersonii.AAC.1
MARARSMHTMWGIPSPGVLACIGMLHDRSSLPDSHRQRGNASDAGEAGSCCQRPSDAHVAGGDDPEGAGGSAVHVPEWQGWAQRRRLWR